MEITATEKRELEERKVSWSELFFDLAFVAGVAQLTYFLIDDVHDIFSFIGFVFLTYVIFLAWRMPTIFANLFPKETTQGMLLVQGETFFALVASIYISSALTTGHVGFAVGIAGIKILTLIQREMRLREYPESKLQDNSLVYAITIATLFWFLSIFVPIEYAIVLWICATLLEYLAPYITTKNKTVVRLNKYHLPERLGLFTMLVLGESLIVVALINKIAILETNIITLFIFFLLFISMLCIWWLYFTTNEAFLSGSRYKSINNVIEVHAWITLAIILIAGGVKKLIEYPYSSGLIQEWYMLSGIALILFSIAVLKYNLQKCDLLEFKFTFLIITLIFVIGLFSPFGFLVNITVAIILFVISTVIHFKQVKLLI